MKSLTSESFAQAIKDAPCVIHFWTAWCGPCFEQEDRLKQLENNFSTVGFYKLNCDENHDLALDNAIVTVPTTILFKGGKAVQRLAGMQGVDSLKEAISQL